MKLENKVIKIIAGKVLPVVAVFSFTTYYAAEKVFGQPSEKSMYHYMVGSLDELGGDLLQGLHNYEAALELDPDSAYIHHAIGNLLMKREDFLYAEVHLKQAIAMNENLVESHISLSNLYMEREDYDSAFKEAKEVIRIDPSNFFGFGFAGDAAFYLGRFAEAREYFEKAATFDIDQRGYTPIYKRLGGMSLKERNYKRAVEEFKKSVYFVNRLHSRSRLMGYESMVGLAESYYNLKSYKKSRETLKKLSKSLEREENKEIVGFIERLLKKKDLELLLSQEESQKED